MTSGGLLPVVRRPEDVSGDGVPVLGESFSRDGSSADDKIALWVGCQIGQQDARSDVVRRVDVEVHGWHAVGAGVGDVLVLYAAHEDAEEVVVQVGRSRVGTDESGQVGSGVAERASPGDGQVQARDYEVVLWRKPDHRVEVTRGAGDHPMLRGLRVRDVRAGAGFAAV